MENIEKIRMLKRPIIVDRDSYVIIDGHHRYEALKRLGVNKIPAILVDYVNEEKILVDKWIRVYRLEKLPREKMIEDFFSGFAEIIIDKNIHYVKSLNNGSALDFYHRIKVFEDKYAEYFLEILYKRSPKNVFRDCFLSKDIIIVIDPPNLSKHEIIKTALENNQLPPKSTRHITFLKKIEFRTSLSYLKRIS
jgi:hypothetical protein